MVLQQLLFCVAQTQRSEHVGLEYPLWVVANIKSVNKMRLTFDVDSFKGSE